MGQDRESSVTDVTNLVSIIVPARNEEAALERCLRSLVEQQGTSFEVIVVDDHSTDRTPEIITKFAGVRECPFLGVNPSLVGVTALEAAEVPKGWTGKSNALWQAAQGAQGDWLLFTDADTVHERGSLARALAEAKEDGAVMLSYSPRQELRGLGERMAMPLVFGELATRFRPKEVSNPEKPAAAANGQYILIRRDVYFSICGHKAVSGELLEDVALAKRVKQAGGNIKFRYGGDQVRARMYRSWAQLVEGWTKNLALLFPDARRLAMRRMTEFAALGFLTLAAMVADIGGDHVTTSIALVLFAAVLTSVLARVRRSHARGVDQALAVFGLPLFARLLMRSAYMHEHGEIEWKGRVYSESAGTVGASHLVDQPSTGRAKGVTADGVSAQEKNGLSHPKV